MPTILDKFNLKDRVAVVTGGVGLLGMEFCCMLVEANVTVAGASFDAEMCCRKN